MNIKSLSSYRGALHGGRSDEHKIRLQEYLELLEARNKRELRQLHVLTTRIKDKVNSRRSKLGLPHLG